LHSQIQGISRRSKVVTSSELEVENQHRRNDFMANLKDTQNDQRPMFNKVSTKYSPGSHTPSPKKIEVKKKHWSRKLYLG
jgi:hypothetical protein